MALSEKILAHAIEGGIIKPFYKGNYTYNPATGGVHIDLAYQTAEVHLTLTDKSIIVDDVTINCTHNEVNEAFAIARKILIGLVDMGYKLKFTEIEWVAKGAASYTLPKFGFVPTKQGWDKMKDAILKNAQKTLPYEVERVTKILNGTPDAIRIIAHSPYAERLLGNIGWVANYSFAYDRAAQRNFADYTRFSNEEEKLINEKIKAHIERIDEINEHMGL